MANIDFIPIDYKQTGDVCLLASYNVCIGYYKNLEKGQLVTSQFKHICDHYIKYMKELQQNVDNEELRKHIQSYEEANKSGKSKMEVENLLSKLLHFYCQKVRPDIRGYQHIFEFNDYLREKNLVGLPQNYSCDLIASEIKPIPNIQNSIIEKIREKEDNLAMIFFNHHSVVIGDSKERGLFKRDTGNKDVEDIKEDDLLQYPISECLLFSRIGFDT